MKLGDYVRLKPSEKLIRPWTEYAQSGTLMRVEQVFPDRGRKSVCIQPAHRRPKSFRHDWFSPDDLVPVTTGAAEPYRDLLRRLPKRGVAEALVERRCRHG